MKTPHFPVHRHRPRRPLVGDNTHLLYNNSHRRPLFFILDTGVEIAVQAINLSTLHRGFIAGAFVRSWRQTEPWPDCISCHFLSQVRECPCRGAAVRICRGLRARAPSQRGGGHVGEMGGCTVAAHCVGDKLNRRLKNGSLIQYLCKNYT